MTGMAGQVGLDDPEPLRALAGDVDGVRSELTIFARGHRILDPLHNFSGALPPGVRQAIVELWTANETAWKALGATATVLDRALAAMAHTAGYVARHLPETDAIAARRVDGIVGEAVQAVPPPDEATAGSFDSPAEG